MTELERELSRIQQEAPAAKQLKTDLAELRSENDELRQRIQHLLDSQDVDDEPRSSAFKSRRSGHQSEEDEDPDHAELQRCVSTLELPWRVLLCPALTSVPPPLRSSYIRSQSPPTSTDAGQAATIDSRLTEGQM